VALSVRVIESPSDGFLRGFDALYPRTIEALVGTDYARLKPRLDEAIDYRNKIFHGQLTASSLSTQNLVDLVTDIKLWCTRLGGGVVAEVGYDGFERNSFRKSAIPDLWKRYKTQFASVTHYQAFIGAHMERR